MKKPRIEHRHEPVQYISYVVGFGLSVIATLLAYFIVVKHILTGPMAVYAVLFIAVVQLIIQMVFFLHIGRGSRWKLMTFVFTSVIVLIVVIGTIWIMSNLDYNMMHMSPDEMTEYMEHNQGL